MGLPRAKPHFSQRTREMGHPQALLCAEVGHPSETLRLRSGQALGHPMLWWRIERVDVGHPSTLKPCCARKWATRPINFAVNTHPRTSASLASYPLRIEHVSHTPKLESSRSLHPLAFPSVNVIPAELLPRNDAVELVAICWTRPP